MDPTLEQKGTFTTGQYRAPMDALLELVRTELKDSYRVDSEIGRGGMATVFCAHDLKHDRVVALKVLSPELGSSIGAERFAREIKIAAGLSHPNILTVFDSGDVGSLLYYTMPFVEGESLRARLERDTYLPVDEAVQVTCQVAGALGYAHARGVVHRDIKPENILLRGDLVLVADFGVARAAQRSDAERLTVSGMSVGTAAYMSPEQSAAEPVDARADIYSLGTTLYEMLAGHPPFTGPNAMAIMARRIMENPPSIRTVRPVVPVELEAAVMRAMERVPADRFQTMAEFQTAVLGGPQPTLSGTTPRYTPHYASSATQPARKTHSRLAIGAGLTALVLVVGAFAAERYFAKRPSAVTSDASKVAVMYFGDDTNKGMQYFADGLTESLIERLSSISALDVISKDGVRQFRGRDVLPDSVGRVLQVGSVVRGSIEPHGKNVRLTVRLVDAPTNVDIARESFDLDPTNIGAAEAQVASHVVDFLRERLGAEVQLRNDRTEARSPEAWILVERANKSRKDADSLALAGARDAALSTLTRADSMLASAAKLDENWARIPTLRAATMYSRARQLTASPAELIAAVDSGVADANEALTIQPNNPEALQVRGSLQFFRYARRVDSDERTSNRLLAEAEADLTRAVDLDRDQAEAWATLSELHYDRQNIQAANIDALNAYRADAYLSSARRILIRLFWTSHDLEQFPEAMRWCNEGRRRYPTDPFINSCRLWMYTTRLAKPDVDSAWIYKKQYIALSPEADRANADKMGDILVAGALARAGLADSARHVLVRARATPAQDPDRELEGNEAVMRVILGDQDEAVRLLADYLTVHPAHRKGFATRVSPWWRDLQSNPKFKQLIAGAR
jgi:eukaryotic-like serine/threonine-protein kinase